MPGVDAELPAPFETDGAMDCCNGAVAGVSALISADLVADSLVPFD